KQTVMLRARRNDQASRCEVRSREHRYNCESALHRDLKSRREDPSAFTVATKHWLDNLSAASVPSRGPRGIFAKTFRFSSPLGVKGDGPASHTGLVVWSPPHSRLSLRSLVNPLITRTIRMRLSLLRPLVIGSATCLLSLSLASSPAMAQ